MEMYSSSVNGLSYLSINGTLTFICEMEPIGRCSPLLGSLHIHLTLFTSIPITHPSTSMHSAATTQIFAFRIVLVRLFATLSPLLPMTSQPIHLPKIAAFFS